MAAKRYVIIAAPEWHGLAGEVASRGKSIVTEVAVYGTLKVGEKNYRRLLAGKEPLFRAVVRIPFRMYANGHYPMLIPASELHPIRIEVFEVDDRELRALDALEEPYDYWREAVPIEELGRSVEIYVHAYPPPAGFSVVESGEWAGPS